MKYYRYGRFRISDYCISWTAIVLLLFFSIASVVLELSFLFVIFPVAYAAIWLWTILSPHREQFVFCDSGIITWVGKKQQKIDLPSELTLIVSDVDICPPLAMRTAIGNKTHILKGKLAISILKKIPKDSVIERLHRNGIQKYTTSRVQVVFDGDFYIYSFVCSQSLLDELVFNRECLVIIPESLLEKIPFDLSAVNIQIDTGC